MRPPMGQQQQYGSGDTRYGSYMNPERLAMLQQVRDCARCVSDRSTAIVQPGSRGAPQPQPQPPGDSAWGQPRQSRWGERAQ
jgi:hypothetical protein